MTFAERKLMLEIDEFTGKDQNDKILLSFTEKEMVCWYIDNIYEHWIKLYSIDKKIWNES